MVLKRFCFHSALINQERETRLESTLNHILILLSPTPLSSPLLLLVLSVVMCLFPFGGSGSGGSVLIPPTAKAARLCSYLRIILAMHAVLVLGLFLSGRFIDGVIDLLGLVVGFLSVRSSDGYSSSSLLCYAIFCAVDLIWSLIREIIFFASDSSTSSLSSVQPWQYYIGVVVIVCAPFIYVSGCCIAWFLHTELKNILLDLAGAFGMGGEDEQRGGRGIMQQQQQPQQSQSQPEAPHSYAVRSVGGNRSVPSQSGFRAFTGTGNRLG